MAKAKKGSRKPSVKVKDLRSKKNPKGGKAQIKDFSFTHVVDKTSPLTTSTSPTNLKIFAADALKLK